MVRRKWRWCWSSSRNSQPICRKSANSISTRFSPHLKAWWRDYHRRGLVIVGVHTPEFAFEGKSSNVRAAVKQLGVTWPVALDARYGTWKAYGNQYWPAEYLIDRDGHVRNVHFGEGEYGRTERLIRQLLGEPGQPQAELADMTPTQLITPETYLGLDHVEDRYVGLPRAANAVRDYGAVRPPPQNDWAYGGDWRVGPERAVSGKRAALALHFHASKVYLVMGGRGSVRISVGGRPLTRSSTRRTYATRSCASGFPRASASTRSPLGNYCSRGPDSPLPVSRSRR